MRMVVPSPWRSFILQGKYNETMLQNLQIIFKESGCLLAYSYDDVNIFLAKPHGRLLEGPEGYALYKNTTDEVLEISATLDDTKKVYSTIDYILLNKVVNPLVADLYLTSLKTWEP